MGLGTVGEVGTAAGADIGTLDGIAWKADMILNAAI
jgi:hypothetical protein